MALRRNSHKQGFASMSEERRKQIAQLGGRQKTDKQTQARQLNIRKAIAANDKKTDLTIKSK